MSGVLLALALVLLVALDLLRDRRRIDQRPVVSHPRWVLLPVASLLPVSAFLTDPALFLGACTLAGASGALLCERFRLTERGIESRGAVLAWSTLRMRRSRLFVHVRTTRGQRLLLPRWMDGLETLARMASGGRLREWSRPGASSS